MSRCPEEMLPKGGRFLNSSNQAPKDCLLGLVSVNPNIALLDIGNTVVRRDYKILDTVKIVSGGSSGHEPMYCGYVGKGMLTAAIHGDVFCSPSTHNILHLLKELSRKKLKNGVLVIIQNNTGDTLNFGLGASKADNIGISVKLLVVTDDCSDEITKRNPRGLTGAIFLQKIAGAMSEELLTLSEIFDYCTKIQNQLASALLCLKSCTSPNKANCSCFKRLSDDELEIGAGLHGEQSPKRICLSSTEFVSGEILKILSNKISFDENTCIALLINNMCVSKLEEGIFVKEIIQQFHLYKVKIMRVYVGTFMTSLDMKGFTVTVLKTDETILKYLDYPTDASYWQTCNFEITPDLNTIIKPRTYMQKYPKIPGKGPQLVEHESNVLLLVTQFACDALISCERQLNIIDGESGDGDTGTRIRIAAENILQLLYTKDLNLVHLNMYFLKLGRVVEDIGGSMGGIYGILFQAAANYMSSLEDNTIVDATLWILCLKEIIKALQSFTQVEVGHNTMLDPLIACSIKAEESKENMSGLEAFGLGVAEAETAAIKTRLFNKVHPDPGAHSVGIWLRAVYEGVKLRCGD